MCRRYNGGVVVEGLGLLVIIYVIVFIMAFASPREKDGDDE